MRVIFGMIINTSPARSRGHEFKYESHDIYAGIYQIKHSSVHGIARALLLTE